MGSGVQEAEGGGRLPGDSRRSSTTRTANPSPPQSSTWSRFESPEPWKLSYLEVGDGWQAKCRKIMRQQNVRHAYQNERVQHLIAVCIIGNFITNVVQKEIDPLEDLYTETWCQLELAWNIIFLLELVWNAYSHWFREFIFSGWNLFDVVVMTVSIPTMATADVNAVKRLRLLRAFRALRFFHRIDSLDKILTALARGVPGMLNAGAVMTLVMCIYGIVGVNLWCDFGEGGVFLNMLGEEVPLVTPRGLSYGEEYWGTFLRALYSLFQVLTGDSWSEAIARPTLFISGGGVAGLYWCSFVMLQGFVLENLVVSVLLDQLVMKEEESGQLKRQGSMLLEEKDARVLRMEERVAEIEDRIAARLDRLVRGAEGLRCQLLAEARSRSR